MVIVHQTTLRLAKYFNAIYMETLHFSDDSCVRQSATSKKMNVLIKALFLQYISHRLVV